MSTLLWFRNDLRLADQAAVCAAVDRGEPVIPVFIESFEEEQSWQPGGASRWWLHHSLAALADQLAHRNSRLIIRRGPALETLLELVQETKATAVYWGRRYEPVVIERDTRVKAELRKAGLVAETFNTSLLHEPWTVATKENKPYQVFTPYSKACLSRGTPAEPLANPKKLSTPSHWPSSLKLEELELLPKLPWAVGFTEVWKPGEAGAIERLTKFANRGVAEYLDTRDRPDVEGVSQLSPHLHFGEVSPRQVWHACQTGKAAKSADPAAIDGYLRQLLWREFAHHLMFYFPHTPEQPLRAKYAKFPWQQDSRALRTWQRGRTGYPIVDAGMRQLWHTGWMHNRVRMIVASFLVKDLLTTWREGAAWFWDTLVDANLANNTLGWQWTAGCGADAAPYFRIFNPVSQGEKFDPDGAYVRRWCPELAKLSNEWIHRPWEASTELLTTAGVKFGRDYPAPMVDHAEAREQALAALKRVGS